MISGLKGFGVKDLTQYLMLQARELFSNAIFLTVTSEKRIFLKAF